MNEERTAATGGCGFLASWLLILGGLPILTSLWRAVLSRWFEFYLEWWQCLLVLVLLWVTGRWMLIGPFRWADEAERRANR